MIRLQDDKLGRPAEQPYSNFQLSAHSFHQRGGNFDDNVQLSFYD
jgi:hypothetical protein